MIARSWLGRVRPEHGDAYVDYLRQTGLAEYRATPGNRGYLVLRREHEGATEFQLLSFWDSLDAIRAFVGDDPQVARYYPEDEQFLLEMTPNVDHWEVAAVEGTVGSVD